MPDERPIEIELFAGLLGVERPIRVVVDDEKVSAAEGARYSWHRDHHVITLRRRGESFPQCETFLLCRAVCHAQQVENLGDRRWHQLYEENRQACDLSADQQAFGMLLRLLSGLVTSERSSDGSEDS